MEFLSALQNFMHFVNRPDFLSPDISLIECKSKKFAGQSKFSIPYIF